MPNPRALVLALVLCTLTHPLPASTISFSSIVPAPQGITPQASLLLASNGYFYGSTYGGGAYNAGTLFKISPSGTRTTLVQFLGLYANGNEAYPLQGLMEASDHNIYGVAGTSIFKMSLDGTFSTLVDFGINNQEFPSGRLAEGPDGELYGTIGADPYRNDSYGSIFKVTTSGTVTFIAGFNFTNGFDPEGGLTLGNDGNFYGVTEGGTDANEQEYPASVYKVTPAGVITIITNLPTGTANGPLLKGKDGLIYGSTNDEIFKITADGTFRPICKLQGSVGSLTQDAAGNLYGVTSSYGAYHDHQNPSGFGSIYKVSPTGTITTLFNFFPETGTTPPAGLVLDPDGNLLGVTSENGSKNQVFPPGATPPDHTVATTASGGVFKFALDGSLTTLATFYNNGGSVPQAGLAEGGDGNLYGTTAGYAPGVGGIFSVSPSGETHVLYTAPAFSNGSLLIGPHGMAYGTVTGTTNPGSVFAVSSSGTYQTIHTFSTTDGAHPRTGLVLGPDGSIYGSTSAGGTSGLGTLFKIAPDGTFSSLASFTGANGSSPNSNFVLGPDGDFYGTTATGGATGAGTVFKFTPGATPAPISTVLDFSTTTGSNPQGLVFASDGNFYGSTSSGTNNYGIFYSLTPTGIFTPLLSLTAFETSAGTNPVGPLVQGPDLAFYGATGGGGTFFLGDNQSGPLYAGTAFRFNPGSQESMTFTSPATIPITTSNYTILGTSLAVTIGFRATVGTVLTAINNTGLSPISGTYSNLPNGGTITTTFAGNTYTLKANYDGGDGNDLTLTVKSVVRPGKVAPSRVAALSPTARP